MINVLEDKPKLRICTHLQELLDLEMPALKKEIELNKWYLSEKAKQDVGWKVAESDFMIHYLLTWAAGFKAAYCGHVCSDKHNCNLNINNSF